MLNFGQTFAVRITSRDNHSAESGGLEYSEALKWASKRGPTKAVYKSEVIGETDREVYATFHGDRR
jgi:hypothetical protein